MEWTWNCNFTKFPQCVCTVFLKFPKADFTKNQHFTEWKNKKFSLTENWRNFHTVHYRYVWFYWLFSRNIYHCVKIATVQYGKHRNLLSNFFSKKFAKATFSLLCSSRVDFTKYFSVIVNFSLFPHCDQLNFLLQGCELPAEIRCKTKPHKKMSETPENNSRKLSQTSSNGDQDELETYTVQDGDNLNKIAAFHDTTPSKLAQLNKLNSRSYVFPGKLSSDFIY